MKNKRIFLVGPMGAGKTSVGLDLAKRMGLDFIDTDQILEQRMQASMAHIILQGGEDNFRTHETQLLHEIGKLNNVVIATGGGVVLMPTNREYLVRCENVCYLKVSLQAQLLRLANCNIRPLLPQEPTLRLNFLKHMQQHRDKLYESVADFKINTDQLAIKYIAAILAKRLEQIYAYS